MDNEAVVVVVDGARGEFGGDFGKCELFVAGDEGFGLGLFHDNHSFD